MCLFQEIAQVAQFGRAHGRRPWRRRFDSFLGHQLAIEQVALRVAGDLHPANHLLDDRLERLRIEREAMGASAVGLWPVVLDGQ
jgi:hypothetical protein